MEVKVKVPKDLAGLLKKHKEIDFGRVARNAIIRRALEAEMAEGIASKSKMTEADAEEIGGLVKEGLRKKYR